jgi:hypothetical protein
MDRLKERTAVWRPRPLTKYKQRPGAIPVAEWHAAQQRAEFNDMTRRLVWGVISVPAIWLVLSLWLLAGQ